MRSARLRKWMENRGLKRHIIEVVPTGDIGFNTGRLRYSVECLSCCVVIHDSTTGPGVLILRHLEDQATPTTKGDTNQ